MQTQSPFVYPSVNLSDGFMNNNFFNMPDLFIDTDVNELVPFANADAHLNVNDEANDEAVNVDEVVDIELNRALIPIAALSRARTLSPTAFSMSSFQEALDNIVAMYGSYVTNRKFKKEAGLAYERKYPVQPREFQTFIKNNIASVRQAHPGKSHQEHMVVIGKLWSTQKTNKLIGLSGEKRTFDEAQT
jgi:hypothetical protein